MKIKLFTPICLFVTLSVNAQIVGTIKAKEAFPKAGYENIFIYQPSKGLAIPDNLHVIIVYDANGFNQQVVPIVKTDGVFQFTFTAPDSATVLIMSVTDEKKNTFDNNNDLGFITYMNDKNLKPFKKAGIVCAELLSGYAKFYLKLNTPVSTILKMYEDEYRKDPTLKMEDSYLNYLTTLYGAKKEQVKPKLIAYANQMASIKKESNLLNAIAIYRLLKMMKEQELIEQKALTNFPKGVLASNKFWNSFYDNTNSSEDSVIASMKYYFRQFNDSTSDIKDRFYNSLIFYGLKNQAIETVDKYEVLVSVKNRLAGMYNNEAWNLCGEDLNAPGNNLDFAKLISKRAVAFIQDDINGSKKGENIENLLTSYDGYADTYALILFKQQKYDSAFIVQDGIFKRGQMGVDGRERYAAFAEKWKGSLFAKEFIEKQLLEGANSTIMLKQLQGIYKVMNLPDDEFLKLKEKSDLLASKNAEKIIRAKFGTLEAKNFTLKNLKGETVSLSNFKNKIVVLDFWAIWCGPCRASFPATQAIITKYSGDDDVVFLFIDTWEQNDFKTMKKNATEFITKNNYSFQVLLDDKDKVVKDYKVEGIPTSFIINKKGEIVFMGHPSSNIAMEIEAARR